MSNTWVINADLSIADERIPLSATKYSEGDASAPAWLSRGCTAIDAVRALVGASHSVSAWGFGPHPREQELVCVRAYGIGEPECFTARPLRSSS